MLDTRFPPWPSFTVEEADAVRDLVLSNRVNYWTGEHGKLFEAEFASHFGSKHAIALANGTVAIDAALAALGIGPGDEVIVTPRSFMASVSSVVNSGAVPVFADIDRDSGNISPATIEAVVTSKTKAVVCVHLGGWPCDMKGIMALAERRSLKVIEDCAQAHGARIDGRSVGTFGNIGTWSFCQDKIMTTLGEGGMVTTDDDALWSSMWSNKDHGKSYAAVYNREHPPGFRWLCESFGTNWRMPEPQSLVGRLQLPKLTEWSKRRQKNAKQIWDHAKKIGGLRVPALPSGYEHAAYKCYVYVDPDRLNAGWNRDRIVHALNESGVPCGSGSCSEIYLERAFDNTGFRPLQRLPVARELGETSIAFLVHPTLTDQHIEFTCQTLADVMRQATV